MDAIYEPKGQAREYSPLACNLYRGCVHGCVYCYSPNSVRRDRAEFHAESKPRPGILAALEKDAAAIAGSEAPVLLCFTCDPYQPLEACDNITRQALETLRRHNVPAQVLTKGGRQATGDFDLLSSMRAWFGTTLVFTDEAWRREWEPNAASVSSRIAAIKEAYGCGIPTWVSIEPVVDPAQAILLIAELSPWVDEWRLGRLNYHPRAKEIDWRHWSPILLQAARDSGRGYLLKESLLPYLSAGERQEARRAPAPPQFQTATRLPTGCGPIRTYRPTTEGQGGR